MHIFLTDFYFCITICGSYFDTLFIYLKKFENLHRFQNIWIILWI